MSNDKTLATVKPGGCVQLGKIHVRESLLRHLVRELNHARRGFDSAVRADYVHRCLLSVLDASDGQQPAAQPSPGGQDALESLANEMDRARWTKIDRREFGDFVDRMKAALAARKPVTVNESDYVDLPDIFEGARQPVGQIVGWQHCGENHEHMVISDRTKQALKEGESERGIQKIEAAYSIPLVRQPVCATVKNPLTIGGGQPVGDAVAVRVTPGMRAAFRRAYREGGFWADRLDTALDAMMRAAPPAQAVDLRKIIEQIAQQWDGCNYDAVGETIDVGRAIRAAGKRLIDSQAEVRRG